MAGSRRVYTDGQVGVRPTTTQARVERANRTLQVRLATAQSPLERLPLIHDHLRLLAKLAHRANPVLTDTRVAELVQRQHQISEELAQIALRGRRNR